jgi:hypothetical protein
MTYAIIKSTDGGFIPFKLYPYQIKVLWDLVVHNLLVILKNRQIGCTWVIAGYAIWKAIFHEAQNVIIISKGEAEAGEVLDYCRFIYNHLPAFLQPKIDRDRAGLLSFPELGSKIRALAATSASGIGFGSASLIIMDEFDFHPNDESNYVEIKPMVDAGGNRQLVILSAPNRIKLNSTFKNIWRGARKGANNFHPVLLTFGAVPYHTEEWYKKMAKDYTQRDLETRYFKTENEAMAITVAGKFFDADKLVMHTSRILNPIINYDGLDLRAGIIRIFKPPMGSNRYVIFADPSSGKEDPFHIVVGEIGSKEEVANAHGWLPADEVALIFDTLVKHYNNAFNSYYRTGYSGGRFQSALENLHTPSQVFSRTINGDEKEGQYGYWESNPLKKQLLGYLRDGLYNLEYIVHDSETLDEMNMMVWEEGKDIPEVPDKEHDDRIITWAGLADLFKRKPNIEFSVTSVKYRETL